MRENYCGHLIMKRLVFGSHATSLAGGTVYNQGLG